MRPTVRNNASQVTRDAITALGVDPVHRLLSLDGPNVEALRPHFAVRAKAAKQKAKTTCALVDDLKALSQRVDEAIAVNPASWSRITGISNYRDHVRVELLRLIAGARMAADQALIESKRRSIPRHDDKGVTSTSHVGRQLIELVEQLRSHDLDRWTPRQVAELIAASQHDWTPSPCPDLAGRYASNIDALTSWIKTRITRARKVRETPGAQGTTAR